MGPEATLHFVQTLLSLVLIGNILESNIFNPAGVKDWFMGHSLIFIFVLVSFATVKGDIGK